MPTCRQHEGAQTMAQYEYECRDCRKNFTVQQTFVEHDRQPKPKCPKCGSRKVEQMVTAAHVQTSKKS
jgi:putative FmdB family regulatory protein